MKHLLTSSTLLLLALTFSYGQKKQLNHEDTYDIWQSIEGEQISRDGEYISYYLQSVNDKNNTTLKIHNSKGVEIFSYGRGLRPQSTFDSKQILFTIKPDFNEVIELRKQKTKKDKLPKDSLGIYDIKSGNLSKIGSLKSFRIPEKWGGWVAYILESIPGSTEDSDTTNTENKKNKPKKISDENGYPLVLRNLENNEEIQYEYVTDYSFAEEGKVLAFVTTRSDSTWEEGVYVYNFESGSLSNIYQGKGKYKHITWDKSGSQLAFLADFDTTKTQIRNFELHISRNENTSSQIAYSGHSSIPDNWIVSEHSNPWFSEDGSKLFFGTTPPPAVKDTTLLDEEIVNLEIWSYTDKRLHTRQKAEMENDKKAAFTAVYHIGSDRVIQIGNQEIQEVFPGSEGNSGIALGRNHKPYEGSFSWEAARYYDLSVVNLESGEVKPFAKKVRGQARISPGSKFVYWYDQLDTAWHTYDIAEEKIHKLTDNSIVPYYDELNDRPDYPRGYGIASWTENDERILINDRYDIWEVDPTNASSRINLTQNGRSSNTRYRYVQLDDEEKFIKKGQDLILMAFDHSTKNNSIYSLKYGRSGLNLLRNSNHVMSSISKAQESKSLIFSLENFNEFPDIYVSDLSFKSDQKVSNANPQQSEYSWGNAELYTFTSIDGVELEGMLFKPENFDPSKKYPLMVNFYEKSSDGLNRYRGPSPPGSSVNYSIYVSRGYVVFNPNINYRIGYPGESAYNCVVPGVLSLIEEGYIDKKRIGVQGHSWGGYQISYLVTKTDLFACAEAGAPVVNMTSAYGGIRWGTGMSRMFQYEHTQSRIGGTLWEYPVRYIENSPLFFADKINTPLMYMHNDADTAVPWYQGIEFFVALRRLGKPVWMFNYQGEPHGLRKMQNREDFGYRMQQFFDHYLMDQPAPEWMSEGIPAMDVGIDQRLNTTPDNK